MNNKFYDYRTSGITQGLLAKFMNCREETKLFLQGWSPKGAQSSALTYGTIVHGILEKVYVDIKSRKIKSAPTSVALNNYVQAVKKLWQNENRNASNDSRKLLEVALGIAHTTLFHYFRKWWRDDTTKIKWEQLEQEFKIPYKTKDGRSTFLRGKIDGVFNNPRLWLFEHKTKSMVNEGALMDTLAYEHQVQFYLYALSQLYKKTPAGVLYDIIRKPSSEPKSGESLATYLNRINYDIGKRPDFYFIRYEISITPAEQQAYRNQLEGMIVDFMDWCDGLVPTYMNTAQCITKYGRCPYLGICSSQQFNLYEKRKEVFRELSGDR